MSTDFESIEDVNKYVEYLRNLDINKTNINIFEDFKKISPERIADKLNIDRIEFTKVFNQYKKEIHNKIIVTSKSNKLSKVKVIPFKFNFGRDLYETRICICQNHFKIKYKSKTIQFYPNVKYLYVCIDDDNIILFYKPLYTSKLYIKINEFNKNFVDIREYNISKIFK